MIEISLPGLRVDPCSCAMCLFVKQITKKYNSVFLCQQFTFGSTIERDFSKLQP